MKRSMDKSKLLSIIIPAYNAEKYVLECLKSLKSLMEDDLEVLVINDGSKDSTDKIVADYAEYDKRVKLVTIPNGGVSNARNTGLDLAAGRYIMFLDSDDYLLSSVFDKLEDIIREDAYDFAAFSRNIIEEDGRIWTEAFSFNEKETLDKTVIDEIMYADSMFNECWGKLFRKTVIDEFDIRFPSGIPVGEDLMFVMEYYSHCEKTFASKEPLVAYRQHGESAMKKYGVIERLKYTQDLYAYAKRFIPESIVEKSLFYNFKVLTNLCREYSRDGVNKAAIKTIYSSEMAAEIMNRIDGNIIPLYRKHEYLLMRYDLELVSSIYYYFKAKAD